MVWGDSFMSLAGGGYKILLLVVLLNHKLLEAEKTFWRSITACFSPLVCFPRCSPETGCWVRGFFALTSWPFLHVLEAQLAACRTTLEKVGFFCVLSAVISWAENNYSHTRKTLWSSVSCMLRHSIECNIDFSFFFYPPSTQVESFF